MKDQKEFYEKYWNDRKTKGRLHTKNGMWIPQRINIAVRMIVEEVKFGRKSSVSVLDVGCGEGTLGKLLKEQLKDKVFVIGCDISDVILNEASIYYDKVFQVNVETDEFMRKLSGQKFDYIVILEVLEHLFKPEIVLKQCYNLLNEDGFLIASFPNIAWYKYRLDMLKGHFPKNYLLYPGEHIQNFTLHSFRKLLEGSGFCPIEIDGQFVFPRIFKPTRIFLPLFKKFPNLFGYQIVVKSKKIKITTLK